MSSELTLLHFHRNMRLHDNAALHIAAGLDCPTVGAFVFPPDCNPRQRVFLRQTLAELRGRHWPMSRENYGRLPEHSFR